MGGLKSPQIRPLFTYAQTKLQYSSPIIHATKAVKLQAGR